MNLSVPHLGDIHQQAFIYDGPFESQIEGRLAGDNYDLQVLDTQWSEQVEAQLQPHILYLGMLLSEQDSNLRGSYGASSEVNTKPLGEMWFVPPSHSLKCSWKPTRFRALSCLFDVSRLLPVAAMDWDWSKVDLESTLNIRSEKLRLGLQQLALEVSNPGFASDVQVECLLTLLACEIHRTFFDGEQCSNETRRLSQAQMRVLRDMLETSAHETPSLDELAQRIRVHPRLLGEMFRNTMGVTLRSFAAQSRIRRAKALLLDGNVMIKQVAFEAGFQSAAAFTTAFRSMTNMTPQQFRKASGVRSFHDIENGAQREP
jgi:AraC family transcriptional regulator